MSCFDSLFDGGLDCVFIAGVCVDHIPFCCLCHGDQPLTRVMIPFTTRPAMASNSQMKTPTTSTQAITTSVLLTIWFLLGQTTFFSSLFISRNQRLTRLAVRAKKFSFLLASAMLFTLSALITNSMLYFVSLWTVCFLQNLQYFFISRRSGSFFLFFMEL